MNGGFQLMNGGFDLTNGGFDLTNGENRGENNFIANQTNPKESKNWFAWLFNRV